MQTIVIERRDAATFIPAVACLIEPENEAQRYLIRRCGYSPEHANVVLFRLNGDGHAYSDPYSWGSRTMTVAHEFILEHWNEVVDGAVVDVEYILGISAVPKRPERETVPI